MISAQYNSIKDQYNVQYISISDIPSDLEFANKRIEKLHEAQFEAVPVNDESIKVYYIKSYWFPAHKNEIIYIKNINIKKGKIEFVTNPFENGTDIKYICIV